MAIQIIREDFFKVGDTFVVKNGELSQNAFDHLGRLSSGR